MKGIVLAGGSGTRLYPLTVATSKQLMPVYDKPMIYYPISTLMLAGARDILIITTDHEAEQFRRLLGDGSQWGIRITYEKQLQPKGIAEALLIGEEFINGEQVALILGDNIFYGPGMGTALQKMSDKSGATVFAYEVENPQRFGVVEFDSEQRVISIEEKPQAPKSNYVIPGLYFYDSTAVARAKNLTPSKRDELEITDIHNSYLDENALSILLLDKNQTWLDIGTIESLFDAANLVRQVEVAVGRKINVPEEVAWRLGLLNDEKLKALALQNNNSGYGKYLLELLVHG